jgi:TonB family protein
MKYLFSIVLLLACGIVALAQDDKPTPAKSRSTERHITIKLWRGEELRGILVKVDNEKIDFKVRDSLQSVDIDKVEGITFAPIPPKLVGAPIVPPEEEVLIMSDSLRPVILYREKARYTKEASEHKTEGTVVLSFVFTLDAKIESIKVVKGLPYGLTESAIEAAKNIRFTPAMKDGKPVSVRGTVEYNFKL